MSNPSRLGKYGTINFKRITDKLSNCDPALNLLFIAGFTIQPVYNQERLIWENTPNNVGLMKDIHSILSLNVDSMENFVALLNEGIEYTKAMDTIKISRIE